MRGIEQADGLEQANGFAIAVDGADIDVRSAGSDAIHGAAAFYVGIHEASQVLVPTVRLLPQLVQLPQRTTADPEASPDPAPARRRRLHLNIEDATLWVGIHDVEVLQM